MIEEAKKFLTAWARVGELAAQAIEIEMKEKGHIKAKSADPMQDLKDVVAAVQAEAPKPRAKKAEKAEKKEPVKDEVKEKTDVKLPEMTEEQSALEVRTTTRAYVTRFASRTPVDGRKQAEAYLAEMGVAGITAMSHPQRLAFIVKLKGEIEAADKVAA